VGSAGFRDVIFRVVRCGLFVAAAVLMSSCSFYLSNDSVPDDARQKAEKIVYEVGNGWDVQTFDRYTAPEFTKGVKPAQVHKLWAIFKRKLGRIVALKISDSKMRATVGAGGSSNQYTYDWKATFAHGDGDLQLITIDRGSGQRILNWNINSEQLIE